MFSQAMKALITLEQVNTSMVEKKLISKTLMVRLTGLGVQPLPQGFSLKKKGGAGKGPGIGWSHVQPKYS